MCGWCFFCCYCNSDDKNNGEVKKVSDTQNYTTDGLNDSGGDFWSNPDRYDTPPSTPPGSPRGPTPTTALLKQHSSHINYSN